MTNSIQLLREYAERGDENSFRQLVEGHIDLVYSAALRRVNGDAHLAQDVAQNVFTDLARKSRRISDDVILSSWLYQHTCFTAANVLRGERRRQIREQQAVEMNTLNDESETAWKQLSPVLEEAMRTLSERDRAAIVLRFFEQQPLREVGTALKISEDAARMRVDRAVGKLRASLLRRGVTMSGVALATLVAGHAVSAAPAGVAATVGTAALTGAATAGSTSAGFLKIFTAMKMKIATAVMVGGAATYFILQSPDAPPSNPVVARQILQGMFNRISAPLPAQMRFVSEVEVFHKAWSNAEILKDVKRQEEAERKRHENVPGLREEDLRKLPAQAQEQRKKDREKLRQLRIRNDKIYHAGKRTFDHQEFLANGLWRLDATETTPGAAELLNKSRPAGTDYDRTMIKIDDSSLTNVASFTIDHASRWAWIRNPPGDNWSRDKSWQAFTLDEEIAFLLTMAVGDLMDVAKQTKSKPKWERDIDSFSGVKMNTNKLEELVSGKDGRWIVETDETTLNNRKMSGLRLNGKTISLAHGTEVAFFADAEHLTNVYRIEVKKMPLIDTPYISSRDDFDANGFPHTWTVETSSPKRLKKIIKFKEVEFPAQFDNKKVFLPEIPKDYTVNDRK